jgi:AcrR family transcriptional regulator
MARPQSDIRERVLFSALARFLNEGVDGASLRRIADDAGTNIGMVYYYFKTKDELFLAVVEEVYAGILADIERILGEDGDQQAMSAPDLIGALYARIARLDAHELDVLRLVLREALVSSERLGHVAKRFENGHVPLVLQMLMRGSARGELNPTLHPAAMLAATATLGVMPQLAHRLLSAARPDLAQLLPPRELLASTMREVLLHGIAGVAAAPATAAIERKPRQKRKAR